MDYAHKVNVQSVGFTELFEATITWYKADDGSVHSTWRMQDTDFLMLCARVAIRLDNGPKE